MSNNDIVKSFVETHIKGRRIIYLITYTQKEVVGM
jgi:hypothetical protein